LFGFGPCFLNILLVSEHISRDACVNSRYPKGFVHIHIVENWIELLVRTPFCNGQFNSRGLHVRHRQSQSALIGNVHIDTNRLNLLALGEKLVAIHNQRVVLALL